MGKRKTDKSRVLDDHKREGKKFVPPFLQLGNVESIKWELPIMPELLWLALLNSSHGVRDGAQLAISLTQAATSVSAKKWFAPISSYLVFTPEQQEQVLEELATKKSTEPLRQALNSLVWFYPDCPLRFIFTEGPTPPENEKVAVEWLKDIVSKLYDRTERIPMMMQANAMYIAFAADLIKVAPHISLANFPEIERYPETQESRRVGSAVRAAITGFFGVGLNMYDKAADWPMYFWNRGLQLESCDYTAIDEASRP